MKLHRRKSFILTIAVIFTLSMLSSVFAFAATENELRNNLDDVESAQDELSRQMTQLSKDIKSLQSDVDALNAKISKTSTEITQTETKIQKKEEEMQSQENNLNQRLRVMYKNGSVGFIDVLLGSNSISEFVSNVSHELKTPLTSMKVLADSLNMQTDAPVELYREFMQDIGEEIDRENIIINDLLSLVKMDKTEADLNIASVAINDLIESILKRLKPIASKRNIELVLESYRPVTAECDEVKLTLALSNLVENAIKYNVAGGWVQVTLDADHKFFYVTVDDSGIGIPEEYQDKIFERFYRVDKARSRETGGTGLGLSITKNIIQMHHGAIKVASKEDEGTTFSVRIPLTYIKQ